MLFKSTVVNLYFRLKSIERSRISDIKHYVKPVFSIQVDMFCLWRDHRTCDISKP